MNDTDFYTESSADLIALETDPVRKELLQRILHRHPKLWNS